MTRSTCWNKEERPQKKTNCIVQPELTYGSQHLEIDLEASAKRGANRTEALKSWYWLSWSLHREEPPNPISHKSTKVDPIRSSRTRKNPTKCPNSLLFSISRQTFPKIQGQLMPMTRVISGAITPKYKTKSSPLARLKVRISSKYVVSF